MNDYDISAIYAGHYHVNNHHTYTRGSKYVSTFLSASANKGLFLVSRYVNDATIYVWQMFADPQDNGKLKIKKSGTLYDFDDLSNPFAITGTTYYSWTQELY